MKNSAISWTDHTFNPWIGCTKVSPGCANCYAATQDKFRKWTPEGWGAGKPRKRTSASNWNEPRRWNRAVAERAASISGPLSAPAAIAAIRPRVFCASLADWLDAEVPVEWLADLLALIRETPHLDWLLLTKRPQNWAPRLNELVQWAMARDIHIAPVMQWLTGTAPANVWIGTTVEDQERADERIPALLKIPARVRFLSCEPLLGPVDFKATGKDIIKKVGGWENYPAGGGVHWVICGGESGPGARPMHPDWARSLRDQCAAAGVAFHFKQWGEWAPRTESWPDNPSIRQFDDVKRAGKLERWEVGASSDRKQIGKITWNAHDQAGRVTRLDCVGKKAAGRLLDGVEHNALPEVRT